MVAVLLADGFEEIEAITPIDFLRRADIEVIAVGVGDSTICGSHGIAIATDVSLENYGSVPQYLVIPGGMPGAKNLYLSEKVRMLLAAVHANKKGVVCAMCAAPAVVLAPLGYLANKRFTCYPTYANDTEDGTYVKDPVVIDGNLITADGAGSAAQFSIAIISHIRGARKAEEIARATMQPSAVA